MSGNKKHLLNAASPVDNSRVRNSDGSLPATFPIVGIGASAGGLSAFQAFFSGIPPNTLPNMAFVLVQHLAPDHPSLLSDLIQRVTHLKVYEVHDGTQVQINCVYVIPPNYDMAILHGNLQLLEPHAPRGQRLPIDFLFNSLADDQRDRSIGIILSGTGSDGTSGVRSIKNAGGMVMTQSVETSEFDGMPCSAVATGLVDFEMQPADMPAQLLAYVEHIARRANPPTGTPEVLDRNVLKKIFVILRAQVGHDFSQYKTSTICRRIERRMAVRQIDDIHIYVKYLQQNPSEVETLFQDLLIGVTQFFRDKEAFSTLENLVIPKLFKGKEAGDAIRVWCAGCSTGEEAYSIAILLQEHVEAIKQNFKIQVFATDIDSRAIAAARSGLFPSSIEGHLSPSRLARFFTPESAGTTYRIQKNIRELLVFSEHNLVNDPPFSKLDLVSCRNLLIYINAELQKRVITLFHYALKPGAMMFLGTSETVGQLSNLFSTVDRKAKLYQRKEDFNGAKHAALHRLMLPAAERDSVLALTQAGLVFDKKAQAGKLSLRELTEKTLLEQFSPACALVNSYGDILYLHGSTGLYLEPAAGESGINNILKMAKPGLRRELTTSLYKAASLNEPKSVRNLRVKTNSHFTLVNFRICTVGDGSAADSPLFLVMFEEADTEAQKALVNLKSENQGSSKEVSAQIVELNEELIANDNFLHAANEELETSNDDLKSSNQEMQSVNEELQSANEELVTSKEELQSINEELATVNNELQITVTDLSRANNDMNNLLAGTGIATVFVDTNLLLLRFTPAAAAIINLIPSDVGRPISHIASNVVDYSQMVTDTQTALNTLSTKEVDVKTVDEKWYTMRIQPYRTLENVVEGAVITFVNITEVVRIREALRKANELVLSHAKYKIYKANHKL